MPPAALVEQSYWCRDRLALPDTSHLSIFYFLCRCSPTAVVALLLPELSTFEIGRRRTPRGIEDTLVWHLRSRLFLAKRALRQFPYLPMPCPPLYPRG